jgi:peroxiredoxin Q/BCP
MTATRTETVPDFRLPASTGQTLERDAFVGKVPMVISFHPGFSHEDTDRLIGSFNELLADFGSQRSQILMVVPETASEVRSYAERHGVRFPILADPALEMARAFDAVAAADDSTMAPRPVLIITDPQGTIVRRFDEVPKEGQAQAALSVIRAEGSSWLDPSGEA